MRARAPASAANLGPGFDALALAVNRYVEVEIEPAKRLTVRSEGEGAGLSDDAGHLAARVAIDVVGHERLAITVRSQIPVARGLGSSAALAVAAAAAAGHRDPMAVAAKVDGHPENAAASTVGGLVVAATVRGAVRVARLPIDPDLELVVMVPDRSLPTVKARQALPAHVHLEDAAFNLGRMGLLLAGLADHELLVKEATEDRLHQDYRAPLFPVAPKLMSAMLAGGALATCWSGAGPSLIGFCAGGTAPSVRTAAISAMNEASVPGRVMILHADREGLITGSDARLPPLLEIEDDGVGDVAGVEEVPSSASAGGADLAGPGSVPIPRPRIVMPPGASAPAPPTQVFDFDADG